jgi:ADP-heptose:LPS heptosyltransferase
MRWIDKNVGVPICFGLSILKGLKNLFDKPLPPKKPKKILFIEMSEMGSMVLAYPLFKKTKELFPDVELHFLTFAKNRYAIDILDVIPHENVVTIDERNFFTFMTSSFRALGVLRKKKITTVFDMEFFSRFTSILSFFSGAPEIVGYYRYRNEGLYRGSLLTHKVVYNPQIHTSFNLLNLIFALETNRTDLPVPKRPLDKKDLVLPRKTCLTDTAKTNIWDKLQSQNKSIVQAGRIILINPNASDIIPLRRWPLESYIQLAARLLEFEGIYIIITGVESERATGEKICQSLDRKRCINFAGKTSFPELIDLYNVSDALVTNDSGPAHFSTLTDIKTFVLFGPETPKLYGPLGDNCHVFYSHFSCSPCVSVYNHRQSVCQDNKCLKDISVEEVFEGIKARLKL